MHMVALNETKNLHEMSVARKAIWNWFIYCYVGLCYWSEHAYCQWNQQVFNSYPKKGNCTDLCLLIMDQWRPVRHYFQLWQLTYCICLQIGHPATSTKPCSQYMAHMTGEHSSGRSERMKLKLSIHLQFWMVNMRISQDISYTDCLLVAWQHMQSTRLIWWCKSVII